MQKILVFGASNESDPVLDCIEEEGKYKVVGFIDAAHKKGRLYRGIEILGAVHELSTICMKFEIYGGIIGTPDNYIRKSIVDKILLVLPQFNFVTTIHPTALVDSNVKIGIGAVVMAGAVIRAYSKIFDFCFVGTNSVVERHGSMQAFASLAEGVYCGGNFNLGMFSAICLGTSIVENIRIGDHTVVFAGSLVVKDVGDNVLSHFTAPEDKLKVVRRPVVKKKRQRTSNPLF